MEWSWNGQFHMEFITIPHGFHWIPYGIWAYPPWIPWTSPHGFHGTNPDGINDYHIYSVLTILSKKKFCTVMKSNPEPHQQDERLSHLSHNGFVMYKTKVKYILLSAPITQMRQLWLKHCHVTSSFSPPPSSTQPIHHRH